MDIYIINMDKNKTRFDNIKEQLEKLKIPYHRESAINGKEMTGEDINKFTSILCRNIICNYGIIGCALSHKKIWRKYYEMENKPEFICIKISILLILIIFYFI